METTHEPESAGDSPATDEQAELRALARLLRADRPPAERPDAPPAHQEPGLQDAAGSAREVGLPPRAAPEGESLRQLLRRRGTLPPRHALEIVRQTLALLEPAHAQGRVHGSLTAECVWLEGRVAWDEGNPFGVRVRLLAADTAPAPEADTPRRELRDVGELLVEMLTGTRLAADTDEWRAFLGPTTARDVAALLARALAPAEGFSSAQAFRLALERLPSRRGWPRHATPLFVAAGLLVLGLGGLLWRAESARAAQRLDFQAELREARDASRLPGACATLDRFLELIEEGEREAARAVVAAARETPELAALGFDCGFLERLLGLREALDLAARTPEPLGRAVILLAAREGLAATREARERFWIRGARWLPLDLPPRPARAADCAGWQASLERELAQLSAALDRPLEERWERLTASAADDPQEALLLARWFADGCVAAYAARLPALAGTLRDELLLLLARQPRLVSDRRP